MLLAGWEVRIGKNCDRGLENAARGRIFKPEVTVFPYTDRPCKLDNNLFIVFSCDKLAYKWLCLRNFVIELALRVVYKPFAKNKERTSEYLLDKLKKEVLKNRFISNYLMLVAFQ